jgi:membrane protease YdiL (CAAX protease family)
MDSHETPAKPVTESRLEWLCLGLFITVAYLTVPDSLRNSFWHSRWLYRVHPYVQRHFPSLVQIGLGLLLVSACPRRSGLCLGDIRTSIRGTIFVCIAPLVLAALVLPWLTSNPFVGDSEAVWLLSPISQDLVFIGYLYGRFDLLFPGFVHPHLPIRWPLVITGLFFAGHHIPNLLDPTFSVGFGLFQLAYTFTGFVFIGLSRQWTGSILYFTANHMAVNWMACTA